MIERFNYSVKHIICFSLLISIFLSLLLNFRNDVINPDGICYLLSAEYYKNASLKEVMHYCPQAHWPFYSLLIYVIATFTHITTLHSAELLNALFSLLSAIVFIFIIRELTANKRILLLAALVFLFNHQLNIFRDNIIRDHGFWFFYLLSFFLLLRFFNTANKYYAIFWGISLSMATLFRVEGMIFLLFVPVCIWFHTTISLKERLQTFILLNLPLFIFFITVIVWQLSHPNHQLNLGRVNEISNQLMNGWRVMIAKYQHLRDSLSLYVLPPESKGDAGPITLILEIGWYLYNLCITISLGYFLLVLYAWGKGPTIFSNKTQWLIKTYLFISVMVTFGFLIENQFISKRYLIAVVLLLLIWVPFAIDALLKKAHSFKDKLYLGVLFLLILSAAISGIIEFGHSKNYIQKAGIWLDENIPKDAKLYVNDFQLMYYSKHFNNDIFIKLPIFLKTAPKDWQQYDYFAVLVNGKNANTDPHLFATLGMPIQYFKNKNGHYVVVYRTNKTTNHQIKENL